MRTLALFIAVALLVSCAQQPESRIGADKGVAEKASVKTQSPCAGLAETQCRMTRACSWTANGRCDQSRQ
jgi:hypothetical protein